MRTFPRITPRIIPRILAAVLAIGVAPSVQAATLFSNFEQPTYPAAPASFIGSDGWVSYYGFSGLSPDPLGSGYVTVIKGNQSGWVAGAVGRGWGDTVSQVFNQFAFSALFEGPDGDSAHAGIYFSHNVAGGTTPAGIEANVDHFDIFGPGDASIPTSVSYVLTHVYRLTMVIDLPNWQFTPTIEDLTVPSSNTPGTYAMYPSFPPGERTLSYVQANGGLVLANTGVWDDLEVPEPGAAALLGVGGLALLRRRRV